MARLKKGDKVLIKQYSQSRNYRKSMLGSVGTIVRDEHNIPDVQFENGIVCAFQPHKLELVEEKQEPDRESRVDTVIRIKYPRVSPSGQRYMSLERSEAIEVYEDLKKVLGL